MSPRALLWVSAVALAVSLFLSVSGREKEVFYSSSLVAGAAAIGFAVAAAVQALRRRS